MTAPGKRQGRRGLCPHPGVRIIWRDRKHGRTFYGRVKRDGGGFRDTNLDELGLRDERDRRAWAIRQSGLIYARRRRAALGLCEEATLDQARERYLRDAAGRLREGTVLAYRQETARFVAWAHDAGRIRLTEDLTPAHLFAYREELIARQPSPSTLGRWLYTVKAMLSWWRKAGLLSPELTKDALADRLSPLPIPRDLPVAYRPGQLRGLLGAALDLGWETACTVSLYLLTGLRFMELVGLEWPAVDLDTPPGGEIRIASTCKTKQGRAVDLSVSAAAVAILERLRKRAGERVLPWLPRYTAANKAYGWMVVPLRRAPGVPADFTWKHLRSSCASYLANAPGVWGAASALRTCRQLGHGVDVGLTHYQGVVRGIPPSATTLEAAMQIEAELGWVAAAIPAEKA